MAAVKPALRHDRKLAASQTKGRPNGALRQQVARIKQGFGRGRKAVLHAQYKGPHTRAVKRAIGNQVSRKVQIARVKNFQLWFDTTVANHLGHDAHVSRCVDHHIGTTVHGVEVKRTNIGLDDGNVFNAFFGWHQGGTGRVNFGVIGIGYIAATWACRQVDHQFGIALANAVHYISVMFQFHGRTTCGGVAHVNVHGACTCFCRCQTFVGNLLGGHGQIGRLLGLGDVACNGACNEGGAI